MNWEDFFKITYHPGLGKHVIHWLSNSKPVLGAPELYIRDNSVQWIKENFRSYLDQEFEKEVLRGSE